MRGNVIKKRINGHSQLWDRADLDTSFLTLENVHPNLKSKFIRTNFRSVLLDFQSFIEKPHFEYLQFCSSCIILIISGYKHFGARLCCMQIGDEIVSNEHVSQLCSFNICNSMDSPRIGVSRKPVQVQFPEYQYVLFVRDDSIRNKWMHLSTVNKVLYKTLLAFDYNHLISLKKDIWKKISPVSLD